MNKFAQAQRQYDAQLPDDDAGPECHKCGEEMIFTSYHDAPMFLTWMASCPNCGAKADFDSRID
jgi:uncharacterized protein (DUF983 family)